jgi:hypothetical protein
MSQMALGFSIPSAMSGNGAPTGLVRTIMSAPVAKTLCIPFQRANVQCEVDLFYATTPIAIVTDLQQEVRIRLQPRLAIAASGWRVILSHNQYDL